MSHPHPPSDEPAIRANRTMMASLNDEALPESKIYLNCAAPQSSKPPDDEFEIIISEPAIKKVVKLNNGTNQLSEDECLALVMPPTNNDSVLDVVEEIDKTYRLLVCIDPNRPMFNYMGLVQPGMEEAARRGFQNGYYLNNCTIRIPFTKGNAVRLELEIDTKYCFNALTKYSGLHYCLNIWMKFTAPPTGPPSLEEGQTSTED